MTGRLIWLVFVACVGLFAGQIGAQAQGFSALARMDGAASGAEDGFRRTQLRLYLSQPVPYRVFTLDQPRRLVVEFREVDFRGAAPAQFTRSTRIDGVRFGAATRPGWSRMVLELAGPIAVEAAGMEVDATDGTAVVALELRPSDALHFAAQAMSAENGAASDMAYSDPATTSRRPAPFADGRLVVVLDPGHGGIDPGAGYGDVNEAGLMLELGYELSAALGRIDGVRVVMTRVDDSFVPLQERLTRARAAEAELFISLHADALEGPQATGASIYTLSDAASDAASQRMAERHNPGDLVAGVDLSGQGDEVAVVLQDLLRVENTAASDRFARHLVQAMGDTGVVTNRVPRREASLAVLRAADFPAVLLEAGFLSNVADRDRLRTAQGRAPIVAAVTLAVQRWALEEAQLAPLVRQ